MSTKIAILIMGIVFTAGLAVSFVIPAFAADDYNSSRSNTSISIANQKVGDVLLRHGIGGAEINEVTDALVRGISTVDLKAMLVKFGVSDIGIQEVFAILDELGTGADSTATGGAVSAPTVRDGEVSVPAAGDTPQSKPYIKFQGIPGAILPDTKDTQRSTTGCKNDSQCSVGNVCFKGLCIPAPPVKGGGDPLKGLNISHACPKGGCPKKEAFHDTQTDIIRNIRAAAPEGRKNLIDKLRANREAFQTEIVSMNLSIRENAKVLRDNFRENVKTTIGHVDHGKTARIAIAHGKGLRMLNRFRSAMARFDHILGRLESRIEKIRIEIEAEALANGVVISVNPPKVHSVLLLIEEAKNIQVENEARMEELKAKYESLLFFDGYEEGKSVRGIAEEARALAIELKTEIENLHDKLREIATAISGFTTPTYEPGKEFAK
jgi:hypothetical protein